MTVRQQPGWGVTMWRWVRLLLVVAAVVAMGLSAFGPSLPAAARLSAQDAADLAAGLPDGLEFETLASGEVAELADAPGSLRLDRIVLAPTSETGLFLTVGPELLSVESGDVVASDELGIEGRYAAGDAFFVPAGVAYALRNDGSAAASLLRVSVAPADSPGTPEAGDASHAVETLLHAEVERLPAPPARLFLARTIWASGVDLGTNVFAGPVGLLDEAGELTVSGPAGIEGQIPPGRGVVFPAGTPNRQRNEDDEPATVLIFGLLPLDQALLAPPPAEPSGEPRLPAAGDVLYEADASTGFAGWTMDGGWFAFEGMLVNDGGGGTATAPYQPTGLANYVVEAEIQLIEGDGGFELLARDGDVSASFHYCCYDNGVSANVYLAGDELASDYVRDIDVTEEGWHTYRLEVDRNTITATIDGQAVVSESDNRLIAGSGGQVGVWCPTGVQINLGGFRVIALQNDSVDAIAADSSIDAGAPPPAAAVPSLAPQSLGVRTMRKRRG